jgi:hypothetical protein
MQLDLFSRPPRRFDEAKLIQGLKDAARRYREREGHRPPELRGLTNGALKRLMTPLPRITAWD